MFVYLYLNWKRRLYDHPTVWWSNYRLRIIQWVGVLIKSGIKGVVFWRLSFLCFHNIEITSTDTACPIMFSLSIVYRLSKSSRSLPKWQPYQCSCSYSLVWSGFWFEIFYTKNYVYCVHKYHNMATTVRCSNSNAHVPCAIIYFSFYLFHIWRTRPWWTWKKNH